MRILANALEFGPTGGIDVHVMQVTAALAARGHELDVVAQRDGPWRSRYESFALQTSVHGDFLHAPLSLQQLRNPARVSRVLTTLARSVLADRRFRPDVIYANDQRALMWACGVAARRRAGIVCHLHGYLRPPLGRQRTAWSRRVAWFVAPSASVRDEWVRHGLPSDRVQVIPQGVDPAAYDPTTPEASRRARENLDIPASAFVVLYLGRVDPDKGVDVLVQAWRSLGLSADAGQLLIVGPTWSPAYVRYLVELAPERSSRFLPGQTDVMPFLRAADVLVLPTVRTEAFGRVMIEAMATGCPVVASSLGGIPEILTGPFSDNLFEPGNSIQLADRLRSLAGWRHRRPSLADDCVNHVMKSYQLEPALDRLEQLLVSAAADPLPSCWQEQRI